MLFDAPVTIDAALAHQHAKAVLPTTLSSSDLQQQLTADVRRQSFFSARTTQAGYLDEAHKMIQNLVSGDTVADPATGELRPRGAGEGFNPSLVRTRMQNFLKDLGYTPDTGTEGTLTDLSSDKRVDLIIDTQTKMAQGYARHEAAQDPDVLADFPADEMYRQRASKKPRDWDITWNTARESLGSATTASLATSPNGPFVALKNDPIWTAISRFGNPYPPFDYSSGMWVRDADDALAARLGVVPSPSSLNAPKTPNAPSPSPSSLSSPTPPTPPASMSPDIALALVQSLSSLFSSP
jgi:hypothetical protein